MNCLACDKLIQGTDLLKCTSCKNMYHYQCLNMTYAYFVDKKADLKKYWICQSCVNTTRRQKKDTPVRNIIDVPNDFDMSCDELPTTPKAPSKQKNVKEDQSCATSTSGAISFKQFSYFIHSKLDIVRETTSVSLK